MGFKKLQTLIEVFSRIPRKLKSLELISSFASYYDRAFLKCKNLESISISTIDDVRSSVLDAIRASLKSNKGLKKLKLQCKVLFDQDFSSEISFKLNQFEVRSLDRQQDVQRNLNLFLKTQWYSLESLSIDKWMDDNVMETILSMPNLKKLSLGLRDVGSYRILPRSYSITNLNLSYQWRCPIHKFVLEAFPNLEILKILELTNKSADIISKTCRSLRQLSIKYFLAEKVCDEEFFMKLEKFTCDEVPPSKPQWKVLFKKLKGKLNKTRRV